MTPYTRTVPHWFVPRTQPAGRSQTPSMCSHNYPAQGFRQHRPYTTCNSRRFSSSVNRWTSATAFLQEIHQGCVFPSRCKTPRPPHSLIFPRARAVTSGGFALHHCQSSLQGHILVFSTGLQRLDGSKVALQLLHLLLKRLHGLQGAFTPVNRRNTSDCFNCNIRRGGQGALGHQMCGTVEIPRFQQRRSRPSQQSCG